MATEFEHQFDNAVRFHLPRPGPGGFTRGSFIGWRRSERVRDDGVADLNKVESLYEVTGKLGEGGFGIVQSAKHRRTGEGVAIKSIHKDKVKEPEELQREVAFLRGVDHPNVIRYYETLQDDEYHYLIMELCTGGSLSEHIRSWHDEEGSGIREADLARIVVQMLRGLAYCHAHSIVHRDIKPANFIFGCGHAQGNSPIPIACSGTADAPLKLVDFGISGVVRADHPNKRLLTRRAGTDGYMAPEVFLGQPYGPSADLFSLGAVMHKMITGQAPQWVADKTAYKFPGKVRWSALSPEGRDLLKRLLSTDPSLRPTASQAIQDPWFQEMGVNSTDDISTVFAQCMTSIRNFAKCSKLQRSIMYSMVAFASLHSDHMEKLRMAFLVASEGSSGGISRSEFSDFVQKYSGSCQDPESPESFFAAVNASQTGQISYSEWLTASAPLCWYREPAHAQRSFETLDVDRNGWISADDLCHLLPDVFDQDQIEDEILKLFPAHEGRMSFEDFCALSCHQDSE